MPIAMVVRPESTKRPKTAMTRGVRKGPNQGHRPTPGMSGQPSRSWVVAVSAAQIRSGYRAKKSIESSATGATVAA